MTATTDRELLLRAILDNPDEDTPRLMYADWLEEQHRPAVCHKCGGDGRHRMLGGTVVVPTRCTACDGTGTADGCDLAELIRLQCRVAELDTEANSVEDCGDPKCVICAERRPLVARVFDLKSRVTIPLWDGEKPGEAHDTPVTTEDGRVEWTFFMGTINTGYHIPQGIYYRLAGQWRFSAFAATDALELAAVAWAKDEGQLPF
jgi:uncharacterized protein (TIGR02996 family)